MEEPNFLKKPFLDRYGTKFLIKIYGRSFIQTIIMIRSCQWGEERRLTNTFSSNLKTVNQNIFSNYGGIKTLRESTG